MKRGIFLAVAAIFVAFGVWLALRSGPPPKERQPVAPVATPGRALPDQTAPKVAPSVVPPIDPPDSAERQQTMVELDKIRRMITAFHTLMGGNPVGTNAEIMKALMGGNPREATLGPPEGQKLNAQGELIDPWGTPYFFHQLSGQEMEIHSAGPDKTLGTPDDVVIR